MKLFNFIQIIQLLIPICFSLNQTRYYQNSKLIFINENELELIIREEFANFIALGDWGGIPVFPFRTIVEKNVAFYMSELAKGSNIHFQMALGDNFYFNGVSNSSDKRFHETFESVFNSRYLNTPWFVLLGNHDYLGNTSAQIEYTKKSNRWILPSENYSINIYTNNGETNLIHILMVDTILLCGNSGFDWKSDYLDWNYLDKNQQAKSIDYLKNIEKHLKKVNAQNFSYIIVAGHYPVLSVAEHGPTPCLVEKLRPLLHKYNVDIYIAGHEHDMEHLTDNYLNNTVQYVVSGASNIVYYSNDHINDVPEDSLKFYWASDLQLNGALALLEANSKNMTISFLETSGKTLYKFVVGCKMN